MSELTFKIIDVLAPAVLALIGAALYLGASYLHKRAEAIESETLRSFVWETTERARSALYSAVRATAQTYVSDLKAAREDGKITEEEAAEARSRAKEHFLNVLGQEGLAALEAVVGNVQEWFESYLEAAVNDLKAS